MAQCHLSHIGPTKYNYFFAVSGGSKSSLASLCPFSFFCQQHNVPHMARNIFSRVNFQTINNVFGKIFDGGDHCYAIAMLRTSVKKRKEIYATRMSRISNPNPRAMFRLDSACIVEKFSPLAISHGFIVQLFVPVGKVRYIQLFKFTPYTHKLDLTMRSLSLATMEPKASIMFHCRSRELKHFTTNHVIMVAALVDKKTGVNIFRVYDLDGFKVLADVTGGGNFRDVIPSPGDEKDLLLLHSSRDTAWLEYIHLESRAKDRIDLDEGVSYPGTLSRGEWCFEGLKTTRMFFVKISQGDDDFDLQVWKWKGNERLASIPRESITETTPPMTKVTEHIPLPRGVTHIFRMGFETFGAVEETCPMSASLLGTFQGWLDPRQKANGNCSQDLLVNEMRVSNSKRPTRFRYPSLVCGGKNTNCGGTTYYRTSKGIYALHNSVIRPCLAERPKEHARCRYKARLVFYKI